ncbi:MAG: type II and III secretion system protein family protein [Deltaproteobacteria bacterium]|nr:type II and III secretion system protein family protein [Deltaproteobacteria bacterium]
MMYRLQSNITKKNNPVGPILAMLFFILFFATETANALVTSIMPSGTIQLVTGKSVVLKSARPVKRVSIADPEIADLVMLSPQEIYITGKASGVTNLTLWQNGTISEVYDLEVSFDISRLKQKLNEMLPEEKELRVIASHNSVTLSGRVSSAASLSQAMALAEAYAPGKGKEKQQVNNLVEVGGVHQVMLEVRIAEMSRSLIKRLGVNFSYINGDDFGVSTLGGLTQLVKPDLANIASGGPFGLFVTPSVNALFRFQSGNSTWTGFVDALKQDGLIKILAEPTLITLSGQSAEFLAGGEFPVPVPQGLGTVAIEYKPFGVGLSFTPTVLSNNKINIKVTPEVSELDFSTARLIEGFLVPGLSTRRASTVIELGDGQSFAIAGLLKETIRDNVQKYPLLGDIPIIGALFRSREFQKNETELVIIATPHLVKPLNMAKQTLPTDFYVEPNDAEIFLFGLMEGKQKSQPVPARGNFDGDFGHAVPGQ